MKLVLILILVSLILISACSPGAVATPSPASPAKPVAETKLKAGWQEKWEQTLSEAKKEAKVSIALTGGAEIRNALKEPFEKRYGIEAEFTMGKGAEQAGRIAAERRAGLFLSDAYCLGNSTSVTVLKPEGWVAPIQSVLILPDVTDPQKWLGGKMPFMDKDRMIIGFLSVYYRPVLINTDLVKKGQIESFYDLLKPEWKGKIVIDDSSISGPGSTWNALMYKIFNEDRGKLRDYLQQLAKQEPVVSRDRRQQVEWVARAKYPIGVGFHSEIGAQMKAAGAPIDIPVMKEGTIVNAASGAVCLASGKLPHPNAAAIFINWLLTQEGQAAFVKGYGNPSARLDVPTTGIDPAFLAIAGEKIHEMDADLLLTTEALQKIFGEVFAPLIK